MGLKPSVSQLKEGSAMLLAQEGGRAPDSDNPYSRIVDKDGKAPASAQALGRDPAFNIALFSKIVLDIHNFTTEYRLVCSSL